MFQGCIFLFGDFLKVKLPENSVKVFLIPNGTGSNADWG